MSSPYVEPLRCAIRDWFVEAQRPLPWREGYDPYAIWIAEMMLQQTQVETVKPYFARWIKHFPDVKALAAAPLAEVLKQWEGLGYYARARNLHKAAQVLVTKHGAQLPADPEKLRQIPGIGPYSAGAIASIGFDVPAPIVDGNVGRVLSRLFALPAPVQSREGKARLWELAAELVPPQGAREFNQGLMELGALICRVRDPACGLCPVRTECSAHSTGDPARYPVRQPRPERLHVPAVLAVVRWQDALLFRHCPENGLWGGLWEFPWRPLQNGDSHEALAQLLKDIALPHGGADPLAPRRFGNIRHGLTHRVLEWECYSLELLWRQGQAAPSIPAGWCWATPAEWEQLALGKPMHKVLRLLENAGPQANELRPQTAVSPSKDSSSMVKLR